MVQSNADIRRNNLARVQSAEVPGPSGLPAFNSRWTRRHWAHASLFATIGALLATLVPGLDTAVEGDRPQAQRMTLSLPLPNLSQLRTRDGNSDRWQAITLKSGQTLGGVFDELGIPQSQLARVMKHPSICLLYTSPSPRD